MHLQPPTARQGYRIMWVLVLCVLLAFVGRAATGSPRHEPPRPAPAVAAPSGTATAPVSAPVSAPPAAAVTVQTGMAATPTHRPAAGPATMVVTLHRGDTLWSLARRHHTTVSTLQRLNHLGHSSRIYAGHHLRVPATTRPVATSLGQQPTATSPATTTVTSDGVARVIAYARAQLGKPYQWGAAGPDRFDCSGLTMRAWATAGVHLPHNAAAQAHTGTRTTRAALAPGDLVISNNYGHVQLYIGNGNVIQAPHTGARVRISPLPPAGRINAYIHLTPPNPGS